MNQLIKEHVANPTVMKFLHKAENYKHYFNFTHDIKCVVSLVESFDTISSYYHVGTFQLQLRQILRYDF